MDIADPEVVQKNNATDATQETPQLGSDRYRVLSTLGAGGMGVVYLAEDLKLHRQVAIKKLREDVATQNARERIQQEARLLAQLNHPNIVALHDVLEDTAGSDTSVALVMEYIEGTTLRAWMRERSPSLQQKLSLLMQICLGLQQAHDLGIIHRDLKADNILIAENAKGEPVAKITDFGIAKSQQLDEKTLTAENQLAGTITAMSPEQILGKTLTARSDLFSLGAIAYELLCGRRPFEKHEAGALAMANRITSEPHIPPQQTWAGIPEPLAVLLDKLLAKEPAQRPESAQIVYQGFALLHKQGMEAEAEDFTATLTDLFTQQKVKSRRRWQRVVAGVAATLILGVGSYWGWKEITRLEPQYIAVMPVEINGEIRGEENAKALTKTMVRQALMNSISQLKASALVSFTPKAGQDFEAQLQKLKDKGVTDALFAKLECAQVRCEIELQRIAPENNQIKQQDRFTFLTEKKQEAQYRTSNSAAQLFAPAYQSKEFKLVNMSDKDYHLYLDVLGRMEAKELSKGDFNTLSSLSDRYPRNLYIYQSLADVAARLFVLDGKAIHLDSALRALDKGASFGVSESQIGHLKLFIYGLGDYSEQYQQLITKFEAKDFPVAELLSERARSFYRNGNYDAGITYAKEAASLNPSSDNLYLIAINETASGNYSAARDTLKNITQTYPKHWSTHSLLGVIELQSGNFEKAEIAIATIPEDLRSWRTQINLGTALLLQKKFSESVSVFAKVLENTPENISALQQQGEAYEILGDQENAHKNFIKVLKLTEETEDLRALQYRALALANLDRIPSAIPLVHRLTRESSKDTFIKYTAAQVYSLADEKQSANYYIEQLLQQGMSTEWFKLPVFQQLCAQPEVSEKVKLSICS
ncbi:serine/threonine-protein kinase [Microbulbifer agarilyticus]|uniref:serine/threonine-protein kinase n=1 Tax=Microbulbifer agarilyticus TaxID=260552 RepID=UPI001CD32054|nr:serine/threonine-protein kinase [Microbulbifer agarilyticus]MCA0892804.1 protein kinase [Microbulbifer agarilyticus]